MIVQRTLADADFGRDGVDADSANSLQIEQPVRGFENAVLHVGFGGQGCHANARVVVSLTAVPPYSVSTQVCVPISDVNCRTRLSNPAPSGEKKQWPCCRSCVRRCRF